MDSPGAPPPALPLVALACGVYGAIETNKGADFRYWLVGDWVRSLA